MQAALKLVTPAAGQNASSPDAARSGTSQAAACGSPARAACEVASLQVRPALRSDRTAIQFFCDAILRNDYFVRHGQLREMLAGRFHQVWVAEIERVLVGIAVTTRGTRLVNALVHPAYRGLGVGRALVEASGAVEVRAKIDMRSGDPRGFYEAMGFRGTGERNGKGNIEMMRKGRKDPGAPGPCSGTKGRRNSTAEGVA